MKIFQINKKMNLLKRPVLLFLVIVAIFILIDSSMQKVAKNREGYTQSNLWAYYLHTDKEIRSAPRDNESCYFIFTAQDGSQPDESSMFCRDDTHLTEIKKYLTSLGYSLSSYDGAAERWTKNDEVLPYFSLSLDKKTQTLTLSKVSFM
ncbi:hypothetical protein [Serratia proteamaculans]